MSLPPGERGPARVPDFFIVGHEKCGTTAMYRMLRKHPEIFMPDFKEPRFFSMDLGAPQPGGARPRTLEQYLALFAGADPAQRVGEASPQYIRSPSAASLIAERQPHARIVAILREPASFLHAFHIQTVQSRLEPERDLRKALALEPARSEGRLLPAHTHPSWLMYSQHVRYVEQLRRFAEHFPAEQILTLIYDDYRRDNAATLAGVMRFLDVDDTVVLEPFKATPERRKAVRFMPLHRISRRMRLARNKPASADPLTRAVARLAPVAAQDLWRRVVYKVPPPPDRALMLELRRRFKPEVEALSEHLGRDLIALWGYDAL